ncbi:MAG: hypothetical protein E7610_09415 [Ruminococcaceae bacterium]|nr:hypothetical protein [Oscillospiraceae bacterium]
MNKNHVEHTDHEKSIHAGHRDRLRKRYQRSGMDDFADHEILELLLTYVIPRIDVNEPAHRLVDRFGSVAGALDALPEELCEIDRVGPAAAQFLTMLPSVFRRYSLNKCKMKEPMDTMVSISEYLTALYTGITFERVYLLLFDNGMRLIDCCHLDDGTVNCSKITLRKAAELCLYKHASCAILAHNHPMGLSIPSKEDIEVTHALDTALDILGITLVEHLIVTDEKVTAILHQNRGLLRTSPITGKVDRTFYERFYGLNPE